MSKFSVELFLFLFTCQVNAQVLTQQQTSFFKKYISPVCADETITSCNWAAVNSSLRKKKIVLIGEPNHGSKEIFLLRNSLINFLHEKHDFDIVLFESGIGELVWADISKDKLTPEQMTFGLFGVWRTKEFRELMHYIKTENMRLAGFDCQRTGNAFRTLLDKTPGIDTGSCQKLEDRFGLIQRELTAKSAVYDSVRPKTQALIDDYQKLFVPGEKATGSNEYLLISRTILNRVAYLRYMLQFVNDKDFHKRWAMRDSLMADNINWLSKTIYKNKKIIVIAHNFHIAKYNKAEKVMGHFLSSQWGKEMYSIGVFAGGGVYADNSGKEVKMVPASTSSYDIKHIIARLPVTVNYLTIPKNKPAGGEWLHQEITVNDTFIDLDGSATMTLAKYFDALIFVSQTSMPEK